MRTTRLVATPAPLLLGTPTPGLQGVLPPLIPGPPRVFVQTPVLGFRIRSAASSRKCLQTLPAKTYPAASCWTSTMIQRARPCEESSPHTTHTTPRPGAPPSLHTATSFQWRPTQGRPCGGGRRGGHSKLDDLCLEEGGFSSRRKSAMPKTGGARVGTHTSEQQAETNPCGGEDDLAETETQPGRRPRMTRGATPI